MREFRIDELEALGQAVANLEVAIGDNPGAFHAAMTTHVAAVGDGLVFALAMKGFVIVHDDELAAEVASHYETAPEQRAPVQ